MQTNPSLHSRRRFFRNITGATAAFAMARFFDPGVFAEELEKRIRTPDIEEGPYYPDHLPRDTDNDLLIINNAITPAVGEVTHLSGKILDSHGDPVRSALIEIWQVDANGSYIHSNGTNPNSGKRDTNFQGYGRFLTSSSGEYYFRTIKPVKYPGRTPHIHVKITARGREQLTTQFFVKGEPSNDRDGVFNGVRNLAARESVVADFVPIKESKIGELMAKVDVVLGLTPEA